MFGIYRTEEIAIGCIDKITYIVISPTVMYKGFTDSMDFFEVFPKCPVIHNTFEQDYFRFIFMVVVWVAVMPRKNHCDMIIPV